MLIIKNVFKIDVDTLEYSNKIQSITLYNDKICKSCQQFFRFIKYLVQIKKHQPPTVHCPILQCCWQIHDGDWVFNYVPFVFENFTKINSWDIGLANLRYLMNCAIFRRLMRPVS